MVLMVDEEREIVRNLIQKALDAGWSPRDWHSAEPEVIREFDVYKYGTKKVTFWNDDAVNFKIHLLDIIFDHRFAKVIWGTEVESAKITDAKGTGVSIDNELWKLHLMAMAIATDRLEYLRDNT